MLHLEDEHRDAEVVRDVLETGGIACEITRVQAREDFAACLEEGRWDVILADYSLPSFDGMSALKIAAARSPDVPFIFVSGTLGEETAIEALKLGATDYVLKERLSRIVGAVRGAVREAQHRAERQQAERELRRSEAFLAEAQRLSHTGSWGWILSTGKVTWSEEQYRLLGFQPGAAEPAVDSFMTAVHEEDRARVRRILEDSTRAGRPYEMDYRVVLPDGSVRHLRTVGRPVPDGAGDVDEYIGTSTDITERVKADEALRQREQELRKTAAELARVNRAATLLVLTASIAHEVNQPLAAMVSSAASCSRWLAARPPEMEMAQRALERIGRDGKRAGEVIDRVRALVQRRASRGEAIDANQAIQEVVALTRDELGRNRIALTLSLARDLPFVTGDRVQVQQVILNLVVNAIEAMSGSGEPRQLVIGSAADGEAVRVEVRDSGPGIQAGQTDEIFEPFYTTKADGIGMGLSISRSIIEAHGGRLWAAPNPPHGAVFRFSLPLEITGERKP